MCQIIHSEWDTKQMHKKNLLLVLYFRSLILLHYVDIEISG